MDKKLRETTNLGVEIMNSKRQLKRKLGHVVQIYFLFWEILNLNLTFANSVNANLNLSNNSTDKLEVDGSLILPHSLSPSVLHFERISSESKNIKKTTFHEHNQRSAFDYGAVRRETRVIDNKFAKCWQLGMHFQTLFAVVILFIVIY